MSATNYAIEGSFKVRVECSDSSTRPQSIDILVREHIDRLLSASPALDSQVVHITEVEFVCIEEIIPDAKEYRITIEVSSRSIRSEGDLLEYVNQEIDKLSLCVEGTEFEVQNIDIEEE